MRKRYNFCRNFVISEPTALGLWVVAGDFNLIYKDEDKNNANYNRALMGRFRRFINDLALKEIPLHGRKFTWSNQQLSPTLVRLDRVLCSVDWEEKFPNCLLQSMASNDSDHCPLLLGLRDNMVGRRRFHFEAFWPKLEGFQEAVSVAWNSVPAGRCPFISLDRKFKEVSKGLQSWSDKKIGHINSQLVLAREILHQLEIAQDACVLAAGEIWLKNNLKKHCLALASLKRTIARLRSRINWPKDFRPISLVHSFAKLVTKLLANRLASRLQQLVSPNQSAFIKGRFIQDNFMLVQQTARFLHQQKQPRILLKLDISKAFDSVSWPFLLEVMQHLGFGPIWRDLVSGLLASSSTQVLLNGIPGNSIVHQRGLRQGDPLSPMLFILVMDVLGHMVSKAANEGLLQPLSRRVLQHRIPLYADDVVLFLRPEAGDIQSGNGNSQSFW